MQFELRLRDPVAELLTGASTRTRRAILRQTAAFTSRHRWPVAPTSHGHTVPAAASIAVCCQREWERDERKRMRRKPVRCSFQLSQGLQIYMPTHAGVGSAYPIFRFFLFPVPFCFFLFLFIFFCFLLLSFYNLIIFKKCVDSDLEKNWN
jgi:hypothetical protein